MDLGTIDAIEKSMAEVKRRKRGVVLNDEREENGAWNAVCISTYLLCFMCIGGQADYAPNTAQKVLAEEVTRVLHGEEGVKSAVVWL